MISSKMKWSINMGWTKAQEQAINSKGCALLLSAAAGSGKTTVLVEKLAVLLCDPNSGVTADNIVVVTFTNAAAAQMRARLESRLETALSELLDSPEPDEEVIDHISEQLSELSAARISTIHSFCFRLIREHAAEAGVDPSFSVIEAEDEKILVKAAISNVLEERSRTAPEDISRLMDIFADDKKNSESFEEILFHLREKLLALPFPKMRENEIVEYYKQGYDKNDRLIVRETNDNALRCARLAAEMSDKLLEFTEKFQKDIDTTPAGKNGKLSPNQYKNLRESLILENRSFKDIITELEKDPSARPTADIIKTLRNVPDFPADCKGTSGKDILNKMRKKYKDTIREYFDYGDCKAENSFTEEEIQQDYKLHAEICTLLFSLLDDIEEEQERMKLDKNVLGFSDSEQIVCGLLCSYDDGRYTKTRLAKQLSEEIGLIMVDEFQDTSKIQELIFKMLSKDGTAACPGTNFFAVGDVKQSIYRFRSAEPSLFLHNLKTSTAYEEGSTEPSHILLNMNFRSSQKIVDFVNTVFCAIMSENVGGVDYGEDEKLVHGAADTECTDIGVITYSGEGKAADKKQSEAAAVACAVKQLIEEGVSPEKICILARNKTKFHIFAAALEERGINTDHEQGPGLLQLAEIRTVISFLRVLDNPTLNVELGAVLMSPLFMFSADDLAQLRITDKNDSLFGNIKANQHLRTPVGEKCGRFMEIFTELTVSFASAPIAEGIERLYYLCDVYAVYSLLPDPAGRISALRQLTETAKSFDKNVGADLSSFLRSLDRSGRIEAAPSVRSDTVALRSIHSSKGLEYDYVILVNTDTNMRLDSGKILFDADLGIAFNMVSQTEDGSGSRKYTTYPAAAVSAKNYRSKLDEEMMLLYVALTRAKKGLMITAPEEANDGILPFIINKDGKNDLAVCYKTMFSSWLRIGTLLADNLRTVTAEELTAREEAEEQTAAPDGELAEKIRRAMSSAAQYDLSLSRLPTKLTVSGIVNALTLPPKEDEEIERPAPKQIHSHMSASERGTAIHAVFERLDLDALANAEDLNAVIKSERERIGDIIGKDSIRCAGEKLIRDFVNSDIFARMTKNGTDNIFRERQFFVKISDIGLDEKMLTDYEKSDCFLQGIADLIFAEGDHYVLVDYKTDYALSEKALTDKYTLQLDLYRKSFSLILDRPITECYIYSTSLGREIKVEC